MEIVDFTGYYHKGGCSVWKVKSSKKLKWTEVYLHCLRRLSRYQILTVQQDEIVHGIQLSDQAQNGHIQGLTCKYY